MALRMGVSGLREGGPSLRVPSPPSREPPKAARAGGFSSALPTECCPEALTRRRPWAFSEPSGWSCGPQTPSPPPPHPRLARQWSSGGLGSADRARAAHVLAVVAGGRGPGPGLREGYGWHFLRGSGPCLSGSRAPRKAAWPGQRCPQPCGGPSCLPRSMSPDRWAAPVSCPRNVPATTRHAQRGGPPRLPGHLVQQAQRLIRAHSSRPRSRRSLRV